MTNLNLPFGSCPLVHATSNQTKKDIEGKNKGECFTLTDLWLARGKKGPLYVTDQDGVEISSSVPTGYWLLKGELYVTGGATLYVHGTAIGGDADILRIQSDSPPLFHEVRAHGGNLSFKSTFVTSWDTKTDAPQEKYEKGRSFINCVSEKIEAGQTCEGNGKNNMGECRMDIIDSEMGHLGYFDSESYGLTWKVRGFCVDKSNPDVFETTNVYGDIKNSDIHHMYYGMYSYGHQGGVWVNNNMHDNHQYGFDPHDDSDYLTISNNKVWGNVNHGEHGGTLAHPGRNSSVLNSRCFVANMARDALWVLFVRADISVPLLTVLLSLMDDGSYFDDT